jgi:uncharacterized membrane protein HdeD (DUF308 family)
MAADRRSLSFPTKKRDIIQCDSRIRRRSPDGRKRNATILIAKIASGANHYRKIANDPFSNAGLTYLAGVITVIIGLLIVTYHNRWTKNWTVLITILGCLALVKGIFLIAFPQFVQSLSERMFTDFGSRVFSYAPLCLGLLFAYFGFVSAAPVDK